MTGVLIRRGENRESHMHEGHVKTETETRLRLPQPENIRNHQEQEEAKKDPLVQASKGAWP